MSRFGIDFSAHIFVNLVFVFVLSFSITPQSQSQIKALQNVRLNEMQFGLK